MLVNGRPALGCRTLTSDLPDVIRLYPLPVFRLIGDLSVDTGTWFRAMAERLGLDATPFPYKMTTICFVGPSAYVPIHSALSSSRARSRASVRT